MNTYTFPIPANLNGEQLREELGAEMVYINDDLLYVVGDLTEAQAAAGIAAHKPITPPDTTAAKTALLARLGITADEAKLLLG
jgi:hypothetical protein